jgi:hypothetical protein
MDTITFLESLFPDSMNDATTSDPTIQVEKSSIERQNDNLRSFYARAFTIENRIIPNYERGSLQSGYVVDKDCNYELHSNGVGRRYSILSCAEGLLVWIQESKDLKHFSIEVRTILGVVTRSYYFSNEELQNLMQRNLVNTTKEHALKAFHSELGEMTPLQVAKEFKLLCLKRDRSLLHPDSLNWYKLHLAMKELSDMLPRLIDESFLASRRIGRKLFLQFLYYRYKSGEISRGVWLVAVFFISTGITLIWRIKTMLEKQLEEKENIKPSDPNFKDWLEATANITLWLIEELESNKKVSSVLSRPPRVSKLIQKKA